MNPKKVYAIDPAFAHRLGFNFSENKGRILENIIFLELLRRGKEVYYYAGKNECDFLVKEGAKVTTAIQVAHAITKENYEREVNGLTEAMKVYNLNEGYLIVNEMEINKSDTYPSIKIISTWEWLMG